MRKSIFSFSMYIVISKPKYKFQFVVVLDRYFVHILTDVI